MIFSTNESESLYKVEWLDPGMAGDATNLYQSIKFFSWHDRLGGRGMLQIVSKPMVSTLNLDGP